MKSQVIKKPAMAAAFARPEACHADQPLDVSLLHRGDEHPRCFGEKPHRLEDDFRPRRNAERLDNDIDPAQSASHRDHLKRIASHCFQVWTVKRNPSGRPRQRTHRMSRLEGGLHGLKAYPSACSDDQDFRHGIMLLVGLAWLIVMCNAGSRTARRASGLHMKGWRECAQVPTMRREGAVAASVASEAAASVALAAAWGNPFNSFDQVRIDHSPNEFYGRLPELLDQSALRPANLTTLAHFSVSSATSLPKSAGEPESTVPPSSANRAFAPGSARLALISLWSRSMISGG